MVRLFFALLPDAPSRARLRTLQAQLPRQSWRLVDPSSLHLTLAFLGQRKEDDVAGLSEAAEGLMPVATSQSSRDWLWLPSCKHPRVLALGVAADLALQTLVEQLWQRLDGVGWVPPERSFLPHVTLARVQQRPAGLTLEAPSTIQLDWALLGLFSSRLTPAGPCYQVLWSKSSGQSSGQT